MVALEKIISHAHQKSHMTSSQKPTIDDVPLETASFSPLPSPKAPAQSNSSWAYAKIGAAVLVLTVLGFMSNVLLGTMTGAVTGISQGASTSLIAGVIGLALVITLAVSAVVPHH